MYTGVTLVGFFLVVLPYNPGRSGPKITRELLMSCAVTLQFLMLSELTSCLNLTSGRWPSNIWALRARIAPLNFLAGEILHLHANRLNRCFLNSLNVGASLDVRMRESFDDITYVDVRHVLH